MSLAHVMHGGITPLSRRKGDGKNVSQVPLTVPFYVTLPKAGQAVG